MVILLNFSHPLSNDQLLCTEEILELELEKAINIMPQFDHEQSFTDQIKELVDGIGLSEEEWQTVPLLINPPALNLIAVTLIAELHGRMGYFPTVIRLKPKSG